MYFHSSAGYFKATSGTDIAVHVFYFQVYMWLTSDKSGVWCANVFTFSTGFTGQETL